MIQLADVVLGPVVAAGALGVIVLMCRWVFSTDTRSRRTAQRRRSQPDARADYGLLVPVAAARTVEDAALLRDVLRAAGVRATLAPGADGRVALLVFRADAARARDLVAS